jgi:hypothetical protein
MRRRLEITVNVCTSPTETSPQIIKLVSSRNFDSFENFSMLHHVLWQTSPVFYESQSRVSFQVGQGPIELMIILFSFSYHSRNFDNTLLSIDHEHILLNTQRTHQHNIAIDPSGDYTKMYLNSPVGIVGFVIRNLNSARSTGGKREKNSRETNFSFPSCARLEIKKDLTCR